LAVRASRLRRLRIRRTTQFSTLAVGALLMVGAAHGAQAQQPFPQAQASAAAIVESANQSSTVVGVWVVEGTSSGPAVKTAALDGAFAPAGGVGDFPAVSVRAVVAGKVHDVTTNASTVGELLSAMGIHPDAGDRVQPSLKTPLYSGLTVSFTNVRVFTETVTEAIPFQVRTMISDALAPGAVQISAAGMVGRRSVTRRVTVVDGHRTQVRTLAATMMRPPVAELRLVGAPSAPGNVPAAGHPTTGQATWYNTPWTGLTAASPWIPFGTHVTVTDVDNGRSVVVVINDRGPFGDPSRIIDLSPQAFSRLDSLGHGVINVRIAW
jgi:Lytic transglycolase/G5 domain/G5-linked-Ubiquitin-like domain